jgi:hypothetical protein
VIKPRPSITVPGRRGWRSVAWGRSPSRGRQAAELVGQVAETATGGDIVGLRTGSGLGETVEVLAGHAIEARDCPLPVAGLRGISSAPQLITSNVSGSGPVCWYLLSAVIALRETVEGDGIPRYVKITRISPAAPDRRCRPMPLLFSPASLRSHPPDSFFRGSSALAFSSALSLPRGPASLYQPPSWLCTC